MISYYCDILEGNDIYGGNHGDKAFQCIRCFIIRDDICNPTKGTKRLEAYMEVANSFPKIFLGVEDAIHRKKIISNFRKKRALRDLEKIKPFPLKFHMVDHIIEDLF